MFIEKFIINFWRGNLKLWHSFWLVGGFGGIIVSQIIIFIEQKIFANSANNLFNFSIRGKLLIVIWVIFSTIGIWRSAEKYTGSTFWKISTKIYISINCISSIYILFFMDIY